jgi:hypothetical protein
MSRGAISSPARYNDGMVRNPYEPPEHADPPTDQPLAPAWRRIVSLPLLIIGGLGLACGLFSVAAERVRRLEIEGMMPGFALAMLIYAGMFAGGLWLRRRPRR